MKLLYLDCSAGCTEEAILAALVDAGADVVAIHKRLNVPHGPSPVPRPGITGKTGAISIRAPGEERWKSLDFLDHTGLAIGPSQWLSAAAGRLRECAGKELPEERPISPEAIFALACIGAVLDEWGIERIESSPIELGRSRMGHGLAGGPEMLPMRLAIGMHVSSLNRASGMVTPGAVAFLAAAVTRCGPMPALRLDAAGSGSSNDRGVEVHVFRGEVACATEANSALLLETNIDDMPSQALDYVMTRLFEAGALDVYFTAIQMKKNRPAVMLSVLCTDKTREACLDIVFSETTTLGVRMNPVSRRCLERSMIQVDTPYGSVPVKIAYYNQEPRSVMPEYDVCRDLAQSHGAPLRRVQDAATAAAWEALGKGT